MIMKNSRLWPFVSKAAHQSLVEEHDRVVIDRGGLACSLTRTALQLSQANANVRRLSRLARTLQRRLDAIIGNPGAAAAQEERVARLCRAIAVYRTELEAVERRNGELVRQNRELAEAAGEARRHKARADQLARTCEEPQAANISLTAKVAGHAAGRGLPSTFGTPALPGGKSSRTAADATPGKGA
jgi:DNA repair ATPase RecN